MRGAGNTARRDKRKSARGYLYALVGANLVIVAAAALVLYWHEGADNARWRLVAEYHMGAAGQTRLALTEIKLLRQNLATFERYTALSEPGPVTLGPLTAPPVWPAFFAAKRGAKTSRPKKLPPRRGTWRRGSNNSPDCTWRRMTSWPRTSKWTSRSAFAIC